MWQASLLTSLDESFLTSKTSKSGFSCAIILNWATFTRKIERKLFYMNRFEVYTCCCSGAYVYTLPLFYEVDECTDGFLLLPGSAAVSHTHTHYGTTYVYITDDGMVYFTTPGAQGNICRKYYQEHYMGKNTGLILLHMCTHLDVHHTKTVNTHIASCFPQAQLLRCIASYYNAEV